MSPFAKIGGGGQHTFSKFPTILYTCASDSEVITVIWSILADSVISAALQQEAAQEKCMGREERIAC